MIKLARNRSSYNSDCAAIDHALREDEAGDTIPGEIVNAILDGVTPLRAWRRHREFTLEMLADQIGVSKEYLSQIESGRKSGTVDAYSAETLDRFRRGVGKI